MKRAFGCDLISTVGFLLWGEFSHKDSYHQVYRAVCVFGLLQMAKTAMEIKNDCREMICTVILCFSEISFVHRRAHRMLV